jgi:SAM-dependent methyltransferase
MAAPPFAEGFTAHNVRLDDGSETFPEAGWLISQSGVLHAVRRTLELVFPDGLAGRSIVDVGCLEGGFTTEFARLGMLATGIEVRESNYRNCMRVKAGTNLPNLSFVKDDAVNIHKYGPFDAVFVSGLLYHLDRPKRFLTDLAGVCNRAVFLETHVARAEETAALRFHNLSDMTMNEDLPGRWFREYESVTREQLETLRWTAWSNSRSFWIQKEYLLQLLKDLGFDLVFEQFDCDDDIAAQHTAGHRKTGDRVLLVGIKSASRARRQSWERRQRM